MKELQITDAELEIMKTLWSAPGGLTSTEIRERLSKDWERTTVLTLLSRLNEKGAVSAEKENRSYRYKSRIAKEDYGLTKTRNLLDSIYNGSVKSMMAALCTCGDLTEEDLRELQALIDQGVK